ncbi:hypothetical protein V1511DRAFT_501439 [Dipodascopsis uninucleata]
MEAEIYGFPAEATSEIASRDELKLFKSNNIGYRMHVGEDCNGLCESVNAILRAKNADRNMILNRRANKNIRAGVSGQSEGFEIFMSGITFHFKPIRLNEIRNWVVTKFVTVCHNIESEDLDLEDDDSSLNTDRSLFNERSGCLAEYDEGQSRHLNCEQTEKGSLQEDIQTVYSAIVDFCRMLSLPMELDEDDVSTQESHELDFIAHPMHSDEASSLLPLYTKLPQASTSREVEDEFDDFVLIMDDTSLSQIKKYTNDSLPLQAGNAYYEDEAWDIVDENEI